MKWLQQLYQKIYYLFLHRPVDTKDIETQLQRPRKKLQQHFMELTPPDKRLEQLTKSMDKVAEMYGIPIIYYPDGSHTFMKLNNVRQLKGKGKSNNRKGNK